MKAQTTLGHPRIAMMCSSKFGEDWWKIEGGISGQQNSIFFLSFRYGGDSKSGKNSDGTTINQIWLSEVTHTTPLRNPTAFRDILSRTEGVYPEQ